MPLDRLELEIFACRFAMGEVARSEIYALANRLANGGIDSQTIVDIIVEGPSGDLDKLLISFLAEQGIAIPTKERVPLDIAYWHAKAYVIGRIPLKEAARKIQQDAWLSDQSHVYDLGAFVYWLDELDDGPPDAKEVALRELDRFARQLVTDFEGGRLGEWIRKASEDDGS